MRVVLASPRGFCAGVNMAVASLETAIRQWGPPVYVYHEIVHNKWVVERFRGLGAVFVDDLSEVPEGAVMLYSAHGVAPEVRRRAAERRLRTVDATCPLVTKIHREAVRFARDGYTIVLIGHARHDEVVGMLGEAPASTVLVEDADDVDRLEVPNPDKVAYLTQTTLSVDDAARIIDRLRRRFPKLVGPAKGDICYATQNRQQAVRELCPQADLVLVIGSQNSSNSRRLAELARAAGVAAHLIDDASEIRLEWFSGVRTVLVTAGASAPEPLVAECVGLLQREFHATVESVQVGEEHVVFPLPKELRAAHP